MLTISKITMTCFTRSTHHFLINQFKGGNRKRGQDFANDSDLFADIDSQHCHKFDEFVEDYHETSAPITMRTITV